MRRYQSLAFRTAYLITRHADDAEDAAQNAFIKGYYALARFRTDAEFKPWLLAIVANEARNRNRGRGRRQLAELRVADPTRTRTSTPSAEDIALTRDRDRALLQAVDRLKESDRLLISCRYLLDLSEAETAVALGCPRGTVKSRLSRAMERLRRSLTPAEALQMGAGRE
ncbi:MAG: sigma-70 family RNA polymerase sigma factor [Frankia sp.]|nr:sigma-70 family RNA polymerase sigma factor [Frankia sp.]